MADRFAMNTSRVEELLDELGIPLPAQVARSRALIDRVGELDVVLKPTLTRQGLAAQALAQVETGTAVDLVRMVQENSAGAAHDEAAAVLQLMQQDAETLHSNAISRSRELLPSARKAIEEVLDAARRLPQDTPTSSEAAVDGDAAAVKSYHALRALAHRYGDLRALHLELIAGSVDATAADLFGDCQHWPTLGMVRAERAGPTDRVRRLLWLATEEAQAWVPAGADCTAWYFKWLKEVREPKAPAPALSAQVVTS
jgi:hypothetical protein